MSSVTKRISEIKNLLQYIEPSSFETIILESEEELASFENIHPSIVGMAVDYLTRVFMGARLVDAFSVSLRGAQIASTVDPSCIIKADRLLKSIKGFDDESIICACQLVAFDAWFRNPAAAIKAKRADETKPDKQTINNIRTMVKRSIAFWSQYGPVLKDGFTFEGGYTKTIDSGDGDYLTKDTVWDFKVTKHPIKVEHALQVLIYYIMGKHSGQREFEQIQKIGIYNPRLNAIYSLSISDIPTESINRIEKEVIGY